MTETEDVERADRLGRRRVRIFAVQAIIFISWQGLFFSRAAEEPMRAVDTVKISAWFVWVLALLLLLATGGNLLRGRKLRALLNDEFTRRNRAQAYVAGFWAAVISARRPLCNRAVRRGQQPGSDPRHPLRRHRRGPDHLRRPRAPERAGRLGGWTSRRRRDKERAQSRRSSRCVSRPSSFSC